jgi:glycerophosphoryl diester phosphodiesterase
VPRLVTGAHPARVAFEPVTAIGYAHRGFSLDGTENSLAAFQAAVDLGYRHLETDARASADGMAVAFHDAVLDRVTNDAGRVAELPWRQLQRARIMGREPIPLLADVLAAFPQAHLNIDVKSDAAIGPTLDALRRTNAWDRVRLAAFSHTRLRLLRRAAGPRVATSLSPPEIALLRSGVRFGLPAGGASTAGTAPVAAQVPAAFGLLTEGFVRHAHRLGIAVHAWTVNTPTQMSRLLELGVDGIITDRADLLRDVLTERGAWPG